MKFPYQSYPIDSDPAHPKTALASRPVIPIRIIGPKDTLQVDALIDSGADWCLFQGSLGRSLGITVTMGKEGKIVGVKGEAIPIFFHQINIEIGGHRISCLAGFSHGLDHLPYGILGQDGFFSHFTTRLDYQGREIEIRPLKRNKKR